jgi:hypothetical protein
LSAWRAASKMSSSAMCCCDQGLWIWARKGRSRRFQAQTRSPCGRARAGTTCSRHAPQIGMEKSARSNVFEQASANSGWANRSRREGLGIHTGTNRDVPARPLRRRVGGRDGGTRLSGSRPHQSLVQGCVIRGISDLLEGKGDADAAGSQVRAADAASAGSFEILSGLQDRSSGPGRHESGAATSRTGCHCRLSEYGLRRPDGAPMFIRPPSPIMIGGRSPIDCGRPLSTARSLFGERSTAMNMAKI